ncbi:MAG: FAD-binding domain-containing protein [Chloroflexi bacterium]|nr:FAD-binding domain-containing protein [Chloroflexota bacterium]
MTGNIANYGTNRDRMDLDGTSALSPYFRFGLLSVQRAALEAMSVGGPGAEAWLTQLAWRDFYFSVLAHFPRVAFENFRPEYDQVDWLDDTRLFDAWCQGRTGYPIVDAAMRQLSETGWMHNRARMIVASFLSKDLLVDWRWGERWFMRHLIDGDLAANNGGWQWTAGTGTDAAPYFRVFNPVSQGLRFDPYGDYVRRWVPELRGLAGPAVHEPWKHAQAMDYGERIVEHDLARMRAIDAFQSARSLAR